MRALEPPRRSVRRMLVGLCALAAAGGVLAARAAPAHAQSAGTATLDGTAFALALSPAAGASAGSALGDAALASYFSRAQCACPSSLTVTLALDDAGAQALGTDSAQATLQLGTDCDNPLVTTCTTVGSALVLDAQNTSASTTVSTSAVFAAAAS